MNHDVDNDQSIILDEDNESQILGDFTFDVKEQLIENIAEGVISRILKDKHIQELSVSEKRNYRGSKRERQVNNPIKEMLKNPDIPIPLRASMPENNKALSSVLKNHDNAKEYLEIVKILYEELIVEHHDFPFKNNENVFSEEQNEIIETLMRMECFMMALMHKSISAFIYYGSTGKYVDKESPSKLAERLTNLGREFLFIWSKEKFIRGLDHDYLTRNIKILKEFFNNLNPNARVKIGFTIEQDITLDSLSELDAHLMALKSFTESGELKKRLASQQLYRTREGDNEPDLFIVRPNRIEFNTAWGANSKKWKDAIKYFRIRFKGKSVLLYRAEIRLHSSKERVKAEQFQKFFGMFNKKANLPKGLEGYSEFLYFWKEDFINQELILDLVSIFEADTLLTKIESDSESEVSFHNRNIRKELEVYLKDSLDQQKELFSDNEVELRFEPTPVLLNPSYEFAPEFLIEVGEQKKWSIFENKIIPYFVFLETFDLPYSDEMGKRFSRSQKRSG